MTEVESPVLIRGQDKPLQLVHVLVEMSGVLDLPLDDAEPDALVDFVLLVPVEFEGGLEVFLSYLTRPAFLLGDFRDLGLGLMKRLFYFSPHYDKNMPLNLKRLNKSFAVLLLFLLPLNFLLPLAHLHQLRHVKAVHVVHVGVYPSGLGQIRMIPLLNELYDTLLTHIHLNHIYLHESSL